MHRTKSRALALILSAICADLALAQSFPARPISIVVPYPAGGVTDGLVRMLGERMKASLGQTILTENVGGAGGTIGVGRVARAAPDGYTLALGNAETMVFAAATMSIPYNVMTDFEPVALLPSYPFLIVTTNAVPVATLKELVAWIKANAEKVSQGTVGAGTVQHLCGVYMQNLIGAKWQFVPYRGGSPAMQDLLSGQFNLMCTASGSFLPLVRSGQIRAYAITANTRSESAPDIPTVDEAGLPGLHLGVWNALWAPKGTPKDVVARINAAAVEALRDPAIRKRIIDMGLDMPPAHQLTPEALGQLHKAETEKWWPIIRAAGLKAE
jgi:tripartite-type tricarboxylate transporter receptor subunit TctC